MKFIGRRDETLRLRKIRELSERSSRFTVLTGRRRIGKTALVRSSYSDSPFLYFFVARRSMTDLCDSFRRQVQDVLGIPIPGRIERFSDLFSFLMKYSETNPLTLVVDEFQDFLRVDPGVFSEMQRDWDVGKDSARMNLIVCGSMNLLMDRIFRDKKEPLYGRQTDFMQLRPFSTSLLQNVLEVHNPSWKPDDLLALYAITGGVAKYLELLVDDGAFTRKAMLDSFFRPDSTFIEEGRLLLSDEFGRDYGVYFSILSAIAEGETTRSAIEQAVGHEVGGHLARLEKDYKVIARNVPLFDKGVRNVRYRIDDCFLRFWFRFVSKYRFMIENGAIGQLRKIVERDWNVFSGKSLESFFSARLAESGEATRIGGWWDRKGESEIDIIAENELEKRMEFYEVKRDPSRFDAGLLDSKVETFCQHVPRRCSFAKIQRCLSLGDMAGFKKMDE